MMKNKLLVALTTVSLLTAGVTTTYAFTAYQKESIKLDQGLTISGGVIRIDPTQGVYLHTNDTHHSRGIKAVGIDTRTGGIKITRDSTDAIISVSADADETLADRNIVTGVSGGGVTTIVMLYQDGERLDLNDPVDFKKVAGTTSNFWIQWISEPR